jgi:hypothetical protein
MSKKLCTCLLILGLVAVGGQAFAVVGANDNVPAATLLLPYFEVDLDAADGITTLFSVNNASAAPALAHVTVWTDLSVPILDFDVYLTGFDVQSFNLRDILVDGELPQTGGLNVPVSNTGAFSAASTPFPNCGANNSVTVYSPLPGTVIGIIQDALTGEPLRAGNAAGSCAGVPFGDRIARGYITVDSVSQCSIQFPNNPGYFVDGGLGIANNNNVLWGDYFYVNPAENFAQGETLVHIEASGAVLGAGLPSCDITDFNPNTFYCRYTAVPGSDNRESLPSMWASRYLLGGAFTGGTDLVVWRSTNDDESTFVCDAGFPPFFLEQNQIVVFDEEENPITPGELPSGPFGAPEESPFPWETQRVEVGPGFSVEDPFGWTYLNLNIEEQHHQAWVVAIMSADGRFSVGFDAIALNNLNAATGEVPGGVDAGDDNVCIGEDGFWFPCAGAI